MGGSYAQNLRDTPNFQYKSIPELLDDYIPSGYD